MFSGNATIIKVIAGTNKLNETGDSYQADLLIAHKEYDPRHLTNDIGLIRVNADIVFKKKVQPIGLPKSDFTKDNYPAVLSGWGTTMVSF